MDHMHHDHSQHDHSAHDHSQHSMHSMDPHHDHGSGGSEDGCSSMHMMVFHTSVCQQILFQGWTSTNAGEMFGACVAVFVCAILYEGLKAWRDLLFNRGLGSQPSTSQMNITKQECSPENNCSGQKIVKYNILSLMHGVQTVLHMVQVFISYLLMLVFMTYSVWLCLALILGTGVGYFLFAWIRKTVVDATEHCH